VAVSTVPAGAVNVPNWYQVTPTASPPPVRDAAMAYDTALGKIVQFGGEINASTYLKSDQTWTYDGTTWTNVTPDPVSETNNPGTRASASMVYDAALGKIVLFGGRVEGIPGYANDTWTFDGTTWTRVSENGALGSPPGRQQAMMTYDAGLGKVVLFGGVGNPSVLLNDTWTFDGTTWTDVSDTTRPSARASGAMAFDPGTASVILFGGSVGGTYFSDTWSWSAGTWTELAPGTSPAARCYSQLVADPESGTLLLYGGYNNSGLGDTWSFDPAGNTGSGAWTQLTPANSPGARNSFGMAYDEATSQMVLFGGFSFGGQVLLGDTWAYGIPPVNPPDAPAAPTAVPGNARVTVSWVAPYDGNAPIESYDVDYKATSGSTWSTQAVTAPTTTATITGLVNGTSYDFRIRAVNSQGPGDWSPITSATPSTVPSAPAAPGVTPGNGQVLVSWVAPPDGGSPITGYTVAYKPTDARKWSTVTSTDTSKTVPGLTNNVEYAFKVLATNANGDGAYSPEAYATPFAANAPGVPTGLTAVAQVNGRSLDVTLSWTDSGNPATDHEVVVYSYRSGPKGATYREVDRFLTSSGDSTYPLSGLSTHKAYAFTVAAGSDDGWSLPSDYSNPVNE
jgi:hypothetical protein